MEKIFISVLNMSLTGSYAILFLILARQLLKKAPKILSYALWSVVAFRLMIPFSFESVLSLIPQNINIAPIPHDIIYQQSPQIYTGLNRLDIFINQSLPIGSMESSISPLQLYIEIASYIWLLGMITLISYSLLSVLKLKNQLKDSQEIEENIFEAENLNTPFVFGIGRPRIYLPTRLNKEEKRYILLHEKTHIRRKDHFIKMLAFLILSIHWFNPLVWIGFTLMAIDMELSCDEKVLKEIDMDIKKYYASSLLSLASGRHIFNGSPLAFGEGNVRSRIENVLNYRKPKPWMIILTLIVTITLGFSLLGNPVKSSKENDNHMGNSYERVDNIEKFVEDILKTILSSPKESSNPQDYINAHNEEYENIFKYGGENALEYILDQFEKGNCEGLRGEIMMRLSKELLGARNNVTDSSLSPKEWYQALEIHQEVSIPDFKYDGTDPVENLVYNTWIGRYADSGKDGRFLVVAPIIYGSYEEDMLKVFTTVYRQSYRLYGTNLSEEGGSLIPVAITYKKDDRGDYSLIGCEEARDGSDFSKSIREYCTMPKSNKEIKGLADKILGDYGTTQDIFQLMYTNLYSHLKKNGVTDALLRDAYGKIVFSMRDYS